MQKTEATQGGNGEEEPAVRAVLNAGELHTLQAAITLRIELCNREVVAARNNAAVAFWDEEKRKAYALQAKVEKLLGHIAAGN